MLLPAGTRLTWGPFLPPLLPLTHHSAKVRQMAIDTHETYPHRAATSRHTRVAVPDTTLKTPVSHSCRRKEVASKKRGATTNRSNQHSLGELLVTRRRKHIMSGFVVARKSTKSQATSAKSQAGRPENSLCTSTSQASPGRGNMKGSAQKCPPQVICILEGKIHSGKTRAC